MSGVLARCRGWAVGRTLFSVSLLAALIAMLAGNWPCDAQAQEGAGGAEAPAPADGGAAVADATPAGEGAAPQQKSRVTWFLQSSGWIGAVILLLSIYFIATVARLFVELRPQIAVPPDVLRECQRLADTGDFKGIFAIVNEDDSPFGLIVSSGMAELSEGVTKAREAMERVGEVITVDMEKKISMLAVLGTLGPMIGLLGTLKGMISSFSVIALSDVQLKASEVAAGISEALLLTFEGVALSVPAIYFFAFFRNRVASLSASTLLEADEFVRRVAKAARKLPGSAGRERTETVVTIPNG